MFPRERWRIPWFQNGCGARNYKCCVCRSRFTPTRPRRNAGKWWPQSDCGVNFVTRRRISDLLTGFTVCVSHFSPCHGGQVWDIRYLWGRDGKGRRNGGKRRVQPPLWKPGPTQDTNAGMPLPRQRENGDPVQDWTKHHPNQNNNVTRCILCKHFHSQGNNT